MSKRGKPKVKKRVERDQGAMATNGVAPALLRWLIPSLIFLLTSAAFLPVLQNSFVDWDDYKTLVENQNYRGLGWAQLRWMFSTFHMGHYQPLSWVTFGLDYLVWGVEPFGYHLTNLFLHAANAVLFYFITLRLLSLALSSPAMLKDLGLRVGAGFAALIFAIHPLRVESVAWATERRDVLSALFFLLTILCYLRAGAVSERNSAGWHWLIAALIVYVLSLLSKAGAITLPVVILILDLYPLGRLGGGPGKWFGPAARRVWWEKVPFLLLAVTFGIIALLAQKGAGALKPLERYDFVSRLAQALYGIAFYLWKSALPWGLSPLYELPVQLNPWDWPFLLSGFVVLAISVCLYLARRTWPPGIAIWVYYLVVLFPVLGIAQSGPQMAADRYSYLSCLGWVVLAGAGIFYLWRCWVSGKISHQIFIGVAVLSLAMLGGLGVLTWGQTQAWHDSERLWRHALAVGQESSTVHYNLAYVLHKRGELAEAVEHYRESLQLNPVAVDAHYELANALADQGALEEAMKHYGQAIEINPYFWRAHYNLAAVLERQGKVEEAIGHYREVVQINPAYVEAHFSLANALVGQRKLAEAIGHYQEAVRIKPDFAEAYNNLGRVLAAQGQLDQAIDYFRRALAIRPEFAEAHASLSQALAEQGKRDEAMQHYQEALRIMRSRDQVRPQR